MLLRKVSKPLPRLPPSFRLIESISDRFSTAWLCLQLGVARSGFYDWRQQQYIPSPWTQENAAITAQIQTVFQRHRGYYGAPRVHQELRAAGLKVGRHRIARLIRCSALKAKSRRGFRPCRNQETPASGVAENLLLQEFNPAAPNRCRAGEITYIRTSAGWRYLGVWIDLYSRRVVGWAMGATIDGYYNREHRHSTIATLSPIDYEQQFINAITLTV